jgi:hypothetical protein
MSELQRLERSKALATAAWKSASFSGGTHVGILDCTTGATTVANAFDLSFRSFAMVVQGSKSCFKKKMTKAAACLSQQCSERTRCLEQSSGY